MATQADVVLAFFLDERAEADVARVLGVTVATLRRWRKRGVPKSAAARVQLEYKIAQQLDEIEAKFYDAQACTEKELGHLPLVRVVRNADGSIDAQLTVFDIPRGKSVHDMVIDVFECSTAIRDILDGYLQGGMRWGSVGTDRPPDSGDRRVRGLAEGMTHWYRSELYGHLQTYMLDMLLHVEGKRRRKPEVLWIRAHWNPLGVQPHKWAERYRRKVPKAGRVRKVRSDKGTKRKPKRKTRKGAKRGKGKR